MGLKARAFEEDRLLNWEIERYRKVLAGVAEVHRYVYASTSNVFDDVYMPDGVEFNTELEHSLIEDICKLRMLDPTQVEYVGPINSEQALSAILVRRQAMQLENAPAAIGAYYANPGDKVSI